MKITYNSNNSGGAWWLSDSDWKNLEKAGWYVIWGGDYFCESKSSFLKKPDGMPEPCNSEKECPGHRKYEKWKDVKNDRYLGALAKEAHKDFKSIDDAIAEFEEITGESADDEGCECCGRPHFFYEE